MPVSAADYEHALGNCAACVRPRPEKSVKDLPTVQVGLELRDRGDSNVLGRPPLALLLVLRGKRGFADALEVVEALHDVANDNAVAIVLGGFVDGDPQPVRTRLAISFVAGGDS